MVPPSEARSGSATDAERHVAQLSRDGYTVVHSAVPADLLDVVGTDIATFKHINSQALARNLDDCGRLCRTVNLHLSVNSLVRVFSRNGALTVCDTFFEGAASLYTSLYFERGSEQSLHRDSPLFCTRPEGRYLGVWAAFEPTDAMNGPLVVVPGSHLLPAIDPRPVAARLFGAGASIPPESDEAWDAYQALLRDQCECAGLAAKEVHVKAGDVIVWHPLLVHGGAKQLDVQRTRHSLVMHVTPVGVPVFHQDVFFAPDRKVPSVPRWSYFDVDERKVAHFNSVDFGHQRKRLVVALRRPGASSLRRVTDAATESTRLLADYRARRRCAASSPKATLTSSGGRGGPKSATP